MNKLDRITEEYARKQAEQREQQFLRGKDTSTSQGPLAGQEHEFSRIARRTLADMARKRVEREMRFERLCGVTEQREKHLLRVKTG